MPGIAERNQLPPPIKFGTSLLGYRLPFWKGDGIIHRRYGRLVSSYASRDLSFPEDIERGFEGISSVLTPYLGKFRWGLPESIIRWAFCWMQSDNMVQRPGFPSYSWVGWQGTILSETHRTDQISPWLSFPDSDPCDFWPPCSVYYWTSRTTMKPIPSRFKQHESTRPNFRSDYDQNYDQKQLCSSDSARWLWNVKTFSGTRWRSHRRYKRFLTVSKPAYKDVASVDFRHVLTFASGVALLAEQPRKKAVRMRPITPIPMFDKSLVVEDEIEASEFQNPATTTQHYIFLGLLDHVAAVFAVIIPVHVDLLAPGIDGNADQLVVQRNGNPCRMKAEHWFKHARKCVVHYH